MKKTFWCVALLSALAFGSTPISRSFAPAAPFIPCVCMGEYDLGRSGANLQETTLTQTNVATALVKLGTFSVSGKPWGQPLYIPNVAVAGAPYNLLIVATSTNNVYAFNADAPGSSPLWSLGLGTPFASGDTNYYDGNIGITSTPVIDTDIQVLYFVSDNSSGSYTLHAVKLSDGTDFHSAVTISGTVSGVTFDPTMHGQRPALLLLSQTVYVAFGSFADVGTWYGWIFAYNRGSLAKTASFLTTPSANEASIWMSGGGLSSDGTNIWGVTANDSEACSPVNYSESFLSFSPSLSVIDYMTPSNCATLDTTDQDLGSSRAVIAGSFVMGGGKDGRFWVLNKGAMGSNQGSGPPIAQVWTPSPSKIYDGFVVANSTLFLSSGFKTTAEPIQAFSCPTTCTTAAMWQTASHFTYSGLSYSSNGATSGTGIVWAATTTGNADVTAQAGTFYALNADTGAILFSDSGMENLAKFNRPTVVNGRVYLPAFSGSDGVINVYGL